MDANYNAAYAHPADVSIHKHLIPQIGPIGPGAAAPPGYPPVVNRRSPPPPPPKPSFDPSYSNPVSPPQYSGNSPSLPPPLPPKPSGEAPALPPKPQDLHNIVTSLNSFPRIPVLFRVRL